MNKKGIVMEEIIFIVLNLIFFVVVMLFIVNSAGGQVVLEQKYAKEIAFIIEEAKPGTAVYLNMGDAFGKTKLAREQVVNIDDKQNQVIVKLSSGGGYMVPYFSDVDVKLEVYGDVLFMQINKKEATS